LSSWTKNSVFPLISILSLSPEILSSICFSLHGGPSTVFLFDKGTFYFQHF
jgi:hypothetical protein